MAPEIRRGLKPGSQVALAVQPRNRGWVLGGPVGEAIHEACVGGRRVGQEMRPRVEDAAAGVCGTLMDQSMSVIALDEFKRAVNGGYADELGSLIRNHADLRHHLDDPLFEFDSPAIVYAANRSNRPIIDVLLEAGAKINQRSKWWAGGFGVLDFAAPELAEYLIARGALVDIHAASHLGKIEIVERFIAEDPASVQARGGDGKTPLHFAATVAVAEYLVEHGADINALDIDHESTPAQYLAGSNADVVRYLIAQGCRSDILLASAVGDAELVAKHLDADAECIRTRVNRQYFPKRDPRSGGTIYIWVLGQNRSAFEVARRFGHDAVLKVLRERGSMEVLLTDAFLRGDEPAVQSLLAQRPGGMGSLSKEDQGALASAAQNNDLAAVELMLRHGWPTAGPGATALHWAAFHGNAAMVGELLMHDPPLEQIDDEFEATPLGWAIFGSEHGWNKKAGNYAETVERLLDAGAKLASGAAGSEAVAAVVARHRLKS